MLEDLIQRAQQFDKPKITDSKEEGYYEEQGENEKIFSSILKGMLEVPSNCSVKVSFDPESKNDHSSIDISVNTNSNVDFSRIYSQMYQLRPDYLSYEAKGYYDPKEFVEDVNFDLRPFTQVKLSKKGWKYSCDPLFQRKEYESELNLSAGADSLSLFDSFNVWIDLERELARKYSGKVNLYLSQEKYQKIVQSFQQLPWQERWKKRAQLRFFFDKHRPDRLLRAMTKFTLGIEHPGTHSYGRIAEHSTLEKLESDLGYDFSPHISNIEIPLMGNKEGSRMLQAIAQELLVKQVAGTSPGELSITKNQAREFMQIDMQSIRSKVEKISASSVLERGAMTYFTKNKTHFPLLERIGRLTGTNWGKVFHSSSRGENIPDEYFPENGKTFQELFQEHKVPPATISKILSLATEKREKWKPEGYLTIHEVYQLAIETLEDMVLQDPDQILKKYLEQYRNRSAEKELRIELKISSQKLDFHPYLLGNKSIFTSFLIDAHGTNSYNRISYESRCLH